MTASLSLSFSAPPTVGARLQIAGAASRFTPLADCRLQIGVYPGQPSVSPCLHVSVSRAPAPTEQIHTRSTLILIATPYRVCYTHSDHLTRVSASSRRAFRSPTGNRKPTLAGKHEVGLLKKICCGYSSTPPIRWQGMLGSPAAC